MDLIEFKKLIKAIQEEEREKTRMKELSKDLETLLTNKEEREEFIRLIPNLFDSDIEIYSSLKAEVVKRIKEAIAQETKLVEDLCEKTKKRELIEINKAFNLIESKFH